MPIPGVIASAYVAPAGGGGDAVRFDAAADKYTRSASGLNISTSITWCCWVKMVVNRGTYSMAMASDNGGSNAIQFGTTSSGTAMVVFANSGGHNPGYSFVVGTWTFIAVTQNLAGNDYTYYAAAPATTTTEVLGGQMTGFFDANTFYIGSDGFGDWWNGSIAAVKVWTAALTKAELETELPKYAPQRTSDLWAAYKFDAGPQTTDDSGNSRTLTAGGTLTTDSSGPPIT